LLKLIAFVSLFVEWLCKTGAEAMAQRLTTVSKTNKSSTIFSRILYCRQLAKMLTDRPGFWHSNFIMLVTFTGKLMPVKCSSLRCAW